MSPRLALSVVAVLLAAGCLSAVPDPVDPADAPLRTTTSVFERAGLPFATNGTWSQTLEGGLHAILDPLDVSIPVKLALAEGGSALDGSARVHMGIWLPDVPEGTLVPVIADIGPYYGDSDVPATEPADRLGRFLIENFVPHGYAVAQVSVFGSGRSTHCMDLMGTAEQAGIDAAVSYLGTQPWSNGAVGLIGRSYDGSTPWQAAMFGNEHLKTIVPISGLIGMHELMWRNGSAETRGPIMHNFVYGLFGVDSDPMAGQVDREDAYNLCSDYVLGPLMGAGAAATGDHFASPVHPYWSERYFLERALANYKGSVYFIHGLQDWNVDPHMAFPTYQRLQAAGLEVKGLFGQWAHMYPDRSGEHEKLPSGMGKEAFPASVRYDWAQDLLEWFGHYLKGTGDKPALHAEVQDNTGAWRIEETYPPLDAIWVELGMGPAKKGHSGQDVITPTSKLTYTFAPLSGTNDTRLAGLHQLHVKVTPTGPGGQLFALLSDAETGLRLGHAVMDLRYASGGFDMKPVAPGMSLVARMEFEAFDAVLPAGHGLQLTLTQTGMDYLPSVVSSPVLVDATDESLLRLGVVERADDVFFTPPAMGAVGTASGPSN